MEARQAIIVDVFALSDRRVRRRKRNRLRQSRRRGHESRGVYGKRAGRSPATPVREVSMTHYA